MSKVSEAFDTCLNTYFWYREKFQECSIAIHRAPFDREKSQASPRFAAFLEPKGQAIALSSCGHVACMDSSARWVSHGFPQNDHPPPFASTGWFVGLFWDFLTMQNTRSVRCIVVDWYWYWLLQKVIAISTPSFKWMVVKSGGSRIP